MSTAHIVIDTVDVEPRRALDLLVLDRVSIRAWERVLFVQCGDGWIVEEAWRRALRAYVCGLDTSPAQVERARRLREVQGKVEFMAWDGRTLPVPDAAFDRVVAILSPAPPQDPAALFRDVRRVLRAEGEAYLLSPATGDGELRLALAQGGWADLRELTRSADGCAVLVRARSAAPASIDQKIV